MLLFSLPKEICLWDTWNQEKESWFEGYEVDSDGGRKSQGLEVLGGQTQM